MSGPSTYQPQNAFLQWFEKRLPIGGLIHSSFVVYPTPKNLNYWWTFGAILSFIGFTVFSLAVIRISAVPGKYEEASLLSTSGSSMNELGFLWNLRSWDLLFVLVAIFAAMLTVVNLFTTEGEVE